MAIDLHHVDSPIHRALLTLTRRTQHEGVGTLLWDVLAFDLLRRHFFLFLFFHADKATATVLLALEESLFNCRVRLFLGRILAKVDEAASVVVLLLFKLRRHLLVTLSHDLVVLGHVHVNLRQEVRVKLEFKFLVLLLWRFLSLSWLLDQWRFSL